MTRNLDAPAVREARLQAASDWLQRLDAPELPEEELQAWLKWHGESDQNRLAFEEMQKLYRQLHDMPEDYRSEMRRRLARPKVRPGWGGLHGLFALAAAVLVVIAGSGTWEWLRYTDDAEVVYAAPHGQHRTVKLADGSALVLAEDAVAAVRYTHTQRLLNIEHGQAYFEVQHNPHRPFIVQAGAVRVTAVGTAFNVARGDDKVTVTVTDGVVDVVRLPGSEDVEQPPGSPSAAPVEHLRVAMGRRVVLGDGLAEARQRDEIAAPAWRNGRVQFVNVPLRQVIEVVNSYAHSPLVIDDPRVADLTYSGTVFRDHVDEWTAALSKIFPVRAVQLDDGTVTLVSRRETVGMK